jgi:hypothetical protein
MTKKTLNSKLECVKHMPELRHSVGNSFDITQSEVVSWLIQQPSILQYLFDKVANGADKCIVYDRERGTWRGTDHEY